MHKQFYLLLLLLLLPTVCISGQQVALKTNVLFLATASPNAGVEIGIGKKFSVDIWEPTILGSSIIKCILIST